MAKTTAQRQKEFKDNRKKSGWKLIWIPPSLVKKVKALIKDLTKNDKPGN
jgi:hypothetical protein